MRSSSISRVVILGVLLLGRLSVPARAGQQQGVEQKVGAQTYRLIRSDVSRPLREIAPLPPDFQDADRAQPVRRWPHFHAPRPLVVEDTVLQADVGPLVSVTPGPNFPGVGRGNYTVRSAPPDTVGAAGLTQYVQWVNTAFAVLDKSTGAILYGPANGNTLWSGFGGRCETNNSGDPIVMYDKAADRWIMTQFAVGAQPYLQCIAVSTTSDATGTYRRFAYEFGNQFNDYPKGGVWPDAYYVTFNMFLNGQTFSGARACAFDRNQMLTANGTPAAMQCFPLSTSFGGLLPSDLDGSTPPPAGAPNYHLAFDDVQQNGLNLWKFHVDWTNPQASTFTGPIKIPGATFTEPCGGNFLCIPQPGTTQRLDSLGDRLMYRLAYRNFGTHESLVVNHSVDVTGVTGVRWYEVRSPGGNPAVYQQGTYAPDPTHRWMGSIAQDKNGNVLLGYSASSTAVQPSIRYTGRLATDPLGTMQAESEMFTGAGSQLPSLNRWGDYSAMTIDPVDDCTFWYTQEYLQLSGTFNWSTRIAAFKFPSCGGNPSPDFSVSASPSSVAVQQGGNATSTITVTSLNGFSSAVTLSASGLPNGVTASFVPNPVAPPTNGSASSTLTLTALPAAGTGTFTVTITGSATNFANRTTPLSLTVTSNGDAVFDPTLKAPKCAAVGNLCDSNALLTGRDGQGPEPNQPNTINNSCADGIAGTFHSDESNDRLRVSTADGSPFAAGKTVKVEATVWAWSGGFASDHLDLYYAANANSPSWTFITTLTPSAAGAQLLSTTYTLPTGTLQAVRARFRYLGAAAPCNAGNWDDHDDLVFGVNAGPTDTTPPTTAITAPAQGATVTGVTTVTALATDNVGVTRVEFYVDQALKATDVTDPYAFAWDTNTYTNGSHSLFSKAYDAAGNVGTSSTVTVTVSNGVATYDSTLKAPKCGTVGSFCDSGTLLTGRDGKGPEPNQPNTINSSCADGTSGTFQVDESNDKIKVSTLDGSALAPGKMVKIEATLWAWSGFTSDHLDLYYAANASSPTWTLVTTLTPSAAGTQTLSATYTLPSGTLQAVRARFRYLGAAAPCSTGTWDDHDDLIFAVGGQAAPTTPVKE